MSPDGSRVAVVVRQEGKRHLAIMSADGTSSRTLAASIDIQGAAGQGTADWSPDGTWIVTGGSDAQGPALFKIPVDGGAPVRLVEGQAVNPVWSPDGNLIVYAGPFVDRPGRRSWECDRTAPRSTCRACASGRAAIASCPTERAWCTCRACSRWTSGCSISPRRHTRQLTRLSNQGNLQTFDITPDGKHIVFDRSRENSDIVLIDLPPR